MRVGATLGRLAGRLIHRRRRIASINLALCFPELSATERETLLNAHFAALGMGVMEVGLAWWASRAKLRPLAHIVGKEHLQRALASGRGVLLLTGHFTAMELGGRFMAFDASFHPVYQRHRIPPFEITIRRNRERHSGLPAISRDQVRPLLRALQQGRMVWYAPDQDYKRQGVFAPFFGVAARTVTATSRLARVGNALVVPYFPERLADGGYRISVLPALENFPSGDDRADAERINRLLENHARRVPEQYLWIHRRFKSRPPGEAKFY